MRRVFRLPASGLLPAPVLLGSLLFWSPLSDVYGSGCGTGGSPEELRVDLERVVTAHRDSRTQTRVIRSLTDPSSRTSSSVTYRMPEIRLAPGEALAFSIPRDLRDRRVSFAVLGHRQDPRTQIGTVPGERRDAVPGLSSVRFHSVEFPPEEAWRYWCGPASGVTGAKFAEIRGSAELEGLYEWIENGHCDMFTDGASHSPLRADAAIVASVGTDPVLISELTIKVLAPKPDRYLSALFTPDTEFGDADTERGRRYGGGQTAQGRFPGALQLPAYSVANVPLPSGWRVEAGDLLIDLPEGEVLTGVDIAGGDSHPDGVQNSDGGWGTQGWSKLSVGMQQGSGSPEWFLRRENVPPEGVMLAAPEDCGRIIRKGDRVRVHADSDTLYVMAIRVGLKSPSSIRMPAALGGAVKRSMRAPARERLTPNPRMRGD